MFDALVEFFGTYGYPPTVRQLGQACGLSSSSTVHAHLLQLVADGYIVREHDKGRPAIRIVGFDTDSDIVIALAKTDPTHTYARASSAGVRAAAVRACTLCFAIAEEPSDVDHDPSCPWLRARDLYAQ